LGKVIFEGWRPGLNKIALTKLQEEKLGLGLRQSKENVDALLDGKQISFTIEDSIIANDFCNEAENLGVICRIE